MCMDHLCLDKCLVFVSSWHWKWNLKRCLQFFKKYYIILNPLILSELKLYNLTHFKL